MIPAIPERIEKVKILLEKLQNQIGLNEVEILCHIDNRIRTIGEKRTELMQGCRGEYFGFVDDDDDISESYIEEILEATKENPDVVTFNQVTTIDGNPFMVSFSLENDNEQAQLTDGKFSDIKRKPFHVCVWKTNLVKDIQFPSINYGEDWHWAEQAIERVKKEKHINRILHYYNFSTELTRAI